MKVRKQLEALKEVLSEEQINTLDEGIKEVIETEINLRVEEKIVELDKKADEYCEKTIEEKVSADKEKLIEDYDKKLAFLKDFKKNEIIDKETFVELKDYLDVKLKNIGLGKA